MTYEIEFQIKAEKEAQATAQSILDNITKVNEIYEMLKQLTPNN